MLILASASSRRHSLLKQIQIDHKCLAVDIDESVRTGESCDAYVMRTAREKALVARAKCGSSGPVLAADTTVCLENEIFGKPSSTAQARDFLKRLSGKTHRVLTAVVLCDGAALDTQLSISNVKLKDLEDDEIEWWLSLKEFSDKAGAYAIQGASGTFVEHLAGSYSGVVGLPLYETTQLLKKVGLWLPKSQCESS